MWTGRASSVKVSMPLQLLLAVLTFCSSWRICCGVQIVVCVDEGSPLTPGSLTKAPFTDVNASFILHTVSHNTSVLSLLSTVNKWLGHDPMTSVIDMTSDCRMSSLAAVVNISFIRVSVISCHDVTSHVVHVMPTLEVYTKVAFSYTSLFGSCLSRVVLLTEYATDVPDYPRCHKTSAIPLLARVVGPWPLNVKQTNQTLEWLRGVARRAVQHYIIVIGRGTFLQQIADLEWPSILPTTFQWLFLKTDDAAFSCSRCVPYTLVIVHSANFTNLLPPAWDVPAGLGKAQAFFLWRAVQTVMTLQASEPKENNTGNELDGFTLSMDFYSTLENDTLDELGVWTAENGLVLADGPLTDFYDPTAITVATIESPPFVFRVTNENGTFYEGYAIDVITEIAAKLDLSFRIVEPASQFGVKLENGTWTGLIGAVTSGAVDIAVGPLTVTAEREAVLDFTTPFYEFAGIEILVKEVSKEQDLLFFVTVFSDPMWGAWFSVLLLTGFLMAVFDFLSPFSPRNTRVGVKDRDTFNLKEGLWLVAASFTLSGPESTPRTLSSRLLVAGFWFFCSIIMANYTANLAAFLTTSRLTTTITSLKDLAMQSKISYSVVAGTSVQEYFERMAAIESNFYELWKNISSNLITSGDLAPSELVVWDYPLGDTYVKIWSEMQDTGFLSSSHEGLDKVMGGNFALIDEAPYLRYAIAQHCGLTTIGKQFSTKSYAFALPQASPLTERVSNVILQLQSTTVLEKLKQKWWRQTSEGCAQVDESGGLSFHTLGGVFLLAGVGVAAGLLLCWMELAWHWVYSKRVRKADIIPPVTSRTDLIQEYDLSTRNDSVSSEERIFDIETSAF